MTTHRPLLWLLGCLLALPCYANEYYEFYRITCTPSQFQIERLGYWDIGEEIWPPNGNWGAHVAALKTLESKGFYVFNEWYGHYEQPVVRFNCGTTIAEFESEGVLREKGPV